MIITNNDWVYEKYRNHHDYHVIFIQGNYKDVLVKTRDKIHEGYELLTHPLSSSLKPNETPFKSIIISEIKDKLNVDSLFIIENSIMSWEKFNNDKRKLNFTEQIIEDFKLIDLTVLESALNNK